MKVEDAAELLRHYDIPIKKTKEGNTLEDGVIEVTELVHVRVMPLSQEMMVVQEVSDKTKNYPNRTKIEDIISDLYAARGLQGGRLGPR